MCSLPPLRVLVCEPLQAQSFADSEESCPGAGRWDIDDWNLDELIGKSFLFYEAQETGSIRSDNRVHWKGDSYLQDSHKGRSLAGGWFDAGGLHFASTKLACFEASLLQRPLKGEPGVRRLH